MAILKPSLHNYNRQSSHWSRRGLVGAWLFNEGDSYVHDYSGNNNSGVWENSDGGMLTSMGPAGRVFEHGGDNTNDRIDLGSMPSVNLLSLAGVTTFTIVWRSYVKSTPLNASPRLIDKSDGGNAQNGWMLWFNDALTQWRVYAGPHGWSSDTSITENVWQSGAFRTFDFTSEASFFYDGQINAATQVDTPAAPSSTTTNMAIGNWNHSTDRQFFGSIDYIYVYNRALEDSEIVYLHQIDPFVGFRSARRLRVVPAAASTLQPIVYHHRHHNRAA